MGLDSICHLISEGKKNQTPDVIHAFRHQQKLGGPGISWVMVGLVACATCHLWVTGLAYNRVNWEAREEASACLL